MRRWSPKENAEIEGKFRGGWIELRGLPFHLWSEKGQSSALLEVTDGEWVFTVAVVVVGEEDCRRGSVKGESTREAFASNTGTGGGRREEKSDQRLEEDAVSRRIIGRGRGKKEGGDEASAVEDRRAYERKAQLHLSVDLQLKKWTAVIKARRGWALAQEEMTQWRWRRRQNGNESPAVGKGKIASGYGLEAQTSSLRCRSENLLSEKDKVVFDVNPEGVDLGADYLAEEVYASPLFSRRYSRIWKHRLGKGLRHHKTKRPSTIYSPTTIWKDFWAEWGPILVAEQSWCCLLLQKPESPSSHFPPSFGSIPPFLSPAAPLFPDQSFSL
ncbi:hypothetical protein CK203_017853 [Vitis vinifera]|uniref:DUF4283 domain-containing protein n=1 Tax=Vitis vinifera TaxID=29760 RepID=A0A438JW87_VITVI|nr:hypothetical protein CK203_017853 [Vitis vinifera]